MKAKYLAILVVALASGCGGNQPDKEAANPLQTQTEALQQAKSVQSVLDKDTARKKKALDELN